MQFRAPAGKMKAKKARVIEGRKIRRETGLPLPIAMGIAKLKIRGLYWEAKEKFPGIVVERIFCECCGTEMQVIGPKGEMRFF